MVDYIDGLQISANILADTQRRMLNLGHTGKLAIILASDDEASKTYVKLKTKKAQEIGILVEVFEFKPGVNPGEVIALINTLNQNRGITGILPQLPFYPHLKPFTSEIVNSISVYKDVDGLTGYQQGLSMQLHPNSVLPATVEAVLECINFGLTSEGLEAITWDRIVNKEVDVENNALTSKDVVILNNTSLIGKPLANLLSNLNATVFLTNKYSQDVTSLTRKADIVVTATGKGQILDHSQFKNDSTIIDVTSIKLEDKVQGDVIYSSKLYNKLSWLTPVPSGVGPVTIACLLRNMTRLMSITNG